MFMCDVTKTPPYARYFVYGELLLIVIVNLHTVTFPLGSTSKTIRRVRINVNINTGEHCRNIVDNFMQNV